MTNYTPLYWAWDGVSLETYAHGIEEFTVGRGGLPPLRGDNRVIPGATGRLHRPKVADQRVIGLSMWIAGQDAEGVVVDLNAWRFAVQSFRALMWDPTNEHVLSKGVLTDAVGTAIRASANAQLTGGMDVKIEGGEEGMMIGRTTAEFTLASPYFVGTNNVSYL